MTTSTHISAHQAFGMTDAQFETIEQLEYLLKQSESLIREYRRALFTTDISSYGDQERTALRHELAVYAQLLKALMIQHRPEDTDEQRINRDLHMLLAEEGMTSEALGVEEEVHMPHMCTCCYGPVTWLEVYRLGCGHEYCFECFVVLVKSRQRNHVFEEGLCCTVPTGFVRQALGIEYALEWVRDIVERATPPQNRLYCFDKRCSAWIDTSRREEHELELACYKCRQNTCARCGEAGHGSVCTAPTAHEQRRAESEQLAKIKDEESRRQCPGCEQLLERNGGCPHFKCPCGTEFCWDCGKLESEGRCPCMRKYMIWWTAAYPELQQ